MASPFAIRHAAHTVRHGGVIAYPTDTVYGLGCDPLNADAIDYLNILKQRDNTKGFILVANSLELFDGYIEKLTNSDKQKIQQEASPTSWVVSAKKDTPAWLTGGSQTLAIRITQHPVISALCNQLKHPLVSSSANPGTKKPALNTLQLHRYFHDEIHTIITGSGGYNGKPSSIKILNSNLTLR